MPRTLAAIPRGLLALAVLAAAAPARADDDTEQQMQRLASCSDSWYEWSREDPARLRQFAQRFHARFEQVPKEPAFLPRAPTRVMGMKVLQAYPDSVGMGLGFSLKVAAGFEEARRLMEQRLGRPMRCEPMENAMSCELELGEKKTALLLTDQRGRAPVSLLGCYYFYRP